MSNEEAPPIATQLQSIVVNISPMAFHKYAEEYLEAARAVPRSQGFSPVPYYLYALSIELALKAFLLAVGVTRKDLKRRNLGHNIKGLLARAEQHNLDLYKPISLEERNEVALANDYYETRALEYFPLEKALKGFPGLPSLLALDNFVSTLLSSIRQLCLSA